MNTALAPAEAAQSTSIGSLSPELLASLRDGYVMSEADRACHNAVTNNEITALALNRSVIRGDDGHFSHRIKSKGITNQQKSGRCWMFAALNVMRPQVIRDNRMAEFEFSTAYLQFWDKLEKANMYLEAVIELRDADFLDREWETVNTTTLEDGGWWNYAVGLVEKYGVVPQSVMPETHGSSNTETLNEVLGRLLRARAVGILDQHADGVGEDGLRAMKNQALEEVYRFLVISFGEPPAEFEWRYKHTGKRDEQNPDAEMLSVEEEDLTPAERFTPQSFYQKFVGRPLSEYVCLYNDPKNELDRHYCFHRARNIVGNECMHFVNIDTAPMKEIAVASILANEPLWFAVNMHHDQSKEHGLMEHQLFDYGALFGVDLAISKADRARFHAGASNHAMTLMGVDLDREGRPRKWLVENSWGEDKGDDGKWTLHDGWFDEHVYTIIVHQSHVPAEIMEHFKQEPAELPAWYPGASGVR
ncbi:MAG: C1 family peptidase [Akkermansiaceae bacterium]|nr:C1 family peptidase [Akkermansiaceae bacterium]